MFKSIFSYNVFFVFFFRGNLNDTETKGLRFIKRLTNLTKDSGETAKLKCEFAGSPPPTKFKWYKNEAPVIEEKGRVIIRR